MEPDGPGGKSGATQSLSHAYSDVTAVPDSKPPTAHCDVTLVQNSDPAAVDCDFTAVPTSAPPPHDSDCPVAEGLGLPTAGDDVIVEGEKSGVEKGGDSRGIKPSPTKLCGYLHKLGGPLKAWKSRWFVYEERNCQLFYYRTAQDASPLGQIQLTDATFSYPLQADEGTFHIQTPQRTFILKAVNREAMMYWLQQLQLRRWKHRDATGQSAQSCASNHREGNADSLAFSTGKTDEFMTIVKAPTGLVGEEAARQPAPRQQAAICNVSFKHPFTEIQNSVRNLRLNRSAQELSRSVFHYDLLEETTPTDPGSPAPKTLTQESPAQTATDTMPPDPLDHSSTSSQLPVTQCEDPEEGGMPLSPSPNLQFQRKRFGHSASLPTHWTRDRMSHLQQEAHALSEELKIQKELVRLLQQALEEARREKQGSVCLASEEKEEALQACQRQVIELTALLQAGRSQQEALSESLAQREAHVVELEQHLRLMEEKSRAKQEVVLALSQQVEACLADPTRPVSNRMETATFHQLQEEIRHLQDDIAAFRTQNKFLNSEIYQLTWLWRRSSEQEKNLMMKCAYMESRNSQKDKRYLGVLRTLQESKQLDVRQQEAVQSLIQEALLGDIQNRLKPDPVREYDDYGFKIVPDFDVEDVKLLAKIQALDIPSHHALQREAQGPDSVVSARWAQYLSSCPSGVLAHSPELKHLLRAGVPREYRQQAWLALVRGRTCHIRDCHPQRYRELLDKSGASPHPASRQIQLDLHRTLTGNLHFSSPSDLTVQQLHRVLLAFSWQNPTIGYCQGLNRIAALALLVLQNEEEAFWCLVAVVETIMPQDYYSKTLAASQADQRVLKDLMVEKLPRLAAHFEELHVDVSLITFNWFLVVLIESLTSHILLQIWDAFLYEGTKVLFRYALALLKYREEDILKIQDKVEMYQYLRFFTKTITDGRKLMNIAFNAMNPLAKKLLSTRRAVHLEQMQVELSELERIQSEYAAQNAKRPDKDLYATVSEDDLSGNTSEDEDNA